MSALSLLQDVARMRREDLWRHVSAFRARVSPEVLLEKAKEHLDGAPGKDILLAVRRNPAAFAALLSAALLVVATEKERPPRPSGTSPRTRRVSKPAGASSPKPHKTGAPNGHQPHSR